MCLHWTWPEVTTHKPGAEVGDEWGLLLGRPDPTHHAGSAGTHLHPRLPAEKVSAAETHHPGRHSLTQSPRGRGVWPCPRAPLQTSWGPSPLCSKTALEPPGPLEDARWGGSGPFAETPDDTPPVPILISTPRGQLDLVTSEPLGLPSTPIQKCILLCSLARSGSGAALTSLGLACCQEAVLRHG